MLQTQETSVAGVVTQSQLERIPVNGRNYTRLLVLMPGKNESLSVGLREEVGVDVKRQS